MIALLIPVVGLVAILDIPFYLTRVSIFYQQYLALFWGLISALLFLTVPAKKGTPRDGVPFYDLLLALISIFLGLYVTLYYPKILFTLGIMSTPRVLLGILAVIIVLETTRRLEGWALTVIILCLHRLCTIQQLSPRDPPDQRGPLAEIGYPALLRGGFALRYPSQNGGYSCLRLHSVRCIPEQYGRKRILCRSCQRRFRPAKRRSGKGGSGGQHASGWLQRKCRG